MKTKLWKYVTASGSPVPRGLGGLAMCLAVVSCGTVASPGVQVSSHRFPSGGKSIQVDRYRPEAVKPGPAPTAVLVLHGAGGMVFDGPEIKTMANELALAGHDAYVVHYFNRAGGPVTFDSGMTRHFDVWVGTVRDTVTWVRESEGQKGAIGLYGYSLGGFLTVAESFHDPRVNAAVVHAGGIWDGYDKGVKQVPPLLMIHGRQDHRVEFNRYVPQMQRFVNSRHGAAQLSTSIYDDQDHRFKETALIKMRRETMAFFDKELKPRPKASVTQSAQ